MNPLSYLICASNAEGCESNCQKMNKIVILNVSIRPQEMNDANVDYRIDDHQIYLMAN